MNGRQSALKTAIEKSPNGALFSTDRKHRYLLWRTWGGSENLLLFIGLNPSVADERENDPTIRRIKSFAQREKASGVLVANLFSLCATHPRDLRAASDPIRPSNDSVLSDMQALATTTVVCWGNHGIHRDRAELVLARLSNPQCFGITKAGEPKHPLYLKSDTELRPLIQGF